MARHLVEFLARPLHPDADQEVPPWVAEASTLVLAIACTAFVDGQDAVAVLGACVVALVALFPLVLGRRTPGQRRTSRWLVWVSGLALLALVVAAGLALGLVVLPPAVTLPLLAVSALPLLVRLVRAVLRPAGRAGRRPADASRRARSRRRPG